MQDNKRYQKIPKRSKIPKIPKDDNKDKCDNRYQRGDKDIPKSNKVPKMVTLFKRYNKKDNKDGPKYTKDTKRYQR
jgi:hypothetical protein